MKRKIILMFLLSSLESNDDDDDNAEDITEESDYFHLYIHLTTQI